MHPIPLDEFIRRRLKWQQQDDRRHVITRDERGRRMEEWWSLGVCRLRTVRFGNELELYADRAPRGTKRPADFGKISFKTWTGSDTPRPLPPPPPPDVIDWAE